MLSVSSSLNTSLTDIYVILYSAVKSARTNTTYYAHSNVTVEINEATAKVRDVCVLRMWFPEAVNTKVYLFCLVVRRRIIIIILGNAVHWLPKQVKHTSEGQESWLVRRISQTYIAVGVVISFMSSYFPFIGFSS